MRVHVRLLGRMNLQAGDVLVPATAFPGRQGRLAFVYLAAHRRAVTRDELAEAIWGDSAPDGWPAHLAAIVSKLRALLASIGLGDSLVAALGAYELCLPADVEVDLEAAAAYLEEANAALRAGQLDQALGTADTAANLARRPLLSGEEAPWLDQLRAALRRTLVYALELEIGLLRQRGDLYDALRLAEEAISLEPFRETAHVHLMLVHFEAGNRAEALRAYERCRRLLATELGIGPSAKTSAAYQQLLHADE